MYVNGDCLVGKKAVSAHLACFSSYQYKSYGELGASRIKLSYSGLRFPLTGSGAADFYAGAAKRRGLPPVNPWLAFI